MENVVNINLTWEHMQGIENFSVFVHNGSAEVVFVEGFK